jgi:DNA-binding FrmR family transcriptional regulator
MRRDLQLVASCRGALMGLMAELIEGHLRFHVVKHEFVAKAKAKAVPKIEPKPVPKVLKKSA